MYKLSKCLNNNTSLTSKLGQWSFRDLKKQNKIPKSFCPALCAQTSFNDVSLKLLEKKHRQAMHPYQDRLTHRLTMVNKYSNFHCEGVIRWSPVKLNILSNAPICVMYHIHYINYGTEKKHIFFI